MPVVDLQVDNGAENTHSTVRSVCCLHTSSDSLIYHLDPEGISDNSPAMGQSPCSPSFSTQQGLILLSILAPWAQSSPFFTSENKRSLGIQCPLESSAQCPTELQGCSWNSSLGCSLRQQQAQMPESQLSMPTKSPTLSHWPFRHRILTQPPGNNSFVTFTTVSCQENQD